MRIDIDALTVEIAGARLVDQVTLGAADGQLVGLVGPNGSGKSTLLRCVYRALRPSAGAVRIGGEDLHALSTREGARRLAALPQDAVAEFDFTVAEIVAMGRLPHQGPMARTTDEDRRHCDEALEGVGRLPGWRGRGGPHRRSVLIARVLIARALAQQPRVLVLDEPTNHLDIAHQLEVLALVRDSGLTVLTALHDLNLAALHCDVVHVIDSGRIVASGPPHDVLTTELLADVFGVRAHRVTHPETGALQLLFDLPPARTTS
ncbi:ABC transporter ATP-binding protein [Streptomyces sp. MBT55]|uniref:ABC transporter ATP-binding protein n=1 Tax=Streptomyces sp. MBT55 TaxID=1488386 RepID=UPI0019117C31|nr:ABC transporter ATP-binding protein [Streptomyces sp. MBT55]MBK6044204.1 ABC transporter ATP-binding protein [Streptomyces sp. MBT55]